jgi:FkbM family methyltransferase
MNPHFFRRITYLYALIFARTSLRRLNTLLFHMSLRGLGLLNYYDDRVSGERNFIRKILPGYVTRAVPVFFDIGANIGDYSATLAKAFPTAKIYAFEPHPVTFSVLSQSQGGENVLCYNKALGSHAGELPLFDGANSNGSQHAALNRDVIVEIHRQAPESHLVEVDTLDRFASSHNIEYIDFMKIDTEGSELSVLQGGRDLLAQKRIGLIQFEFNEMNIYSRSFFNDFTRVLPGYQFLRLLPFGLLELPKTPVLTELFGFQNLLAVPTE